MSVRTRPFRLSWIFLVAALAAIPAPAAAAEMLAGQALAQALRGGGYVLVMRHANSPAAVPGKAAADPENIALERQLDAMGRETARAMGEAFRTIGIPLGEVLSSPTYRTRQTVRFAGFGAAITFVQLEEGAAGMAANAEKERADFLRAKANERPRPGTNTTIVTHSPNIQAAFAGDGAGVASGETLVFRPGANGATLVARVKIEDWPKLAAGG